MRERHCAATLNAKTTLSSFSLVFSETGSSFIGDFRKFNLRMAHLIVVTIALTSGAQVTLG